MSAEKKYYEAYEERYARVYAQGVEYWTGNPAEIATVTSLADAFLDCVHAAPDSHYIVEFGCGEGYLGEHLLKRGFRYLGIDLSPSALAKARERCAAPDSTFLLGDITCVPGIRSRSFDLALDNYCLHMLVTDDDRRQYLAEVFRVLAPGGYAWFHEIAQRDQFTDRITSIEDFLAKYPMDLTACEPREAHSEDGARTVHIPRLPARFNNCEGYREEIEAAGFGVEYIESRESGIVIRARKVE